MNSEAPAAPITLLSAVLGQDRAVSTLHAAVASGRVHHAWIFAGPPGVGKFTTALAFGALVLDPTTAPDLAGVPAPEADSQTQRLVARGAHPDLHIITRELARFSDDKQVRDRKLTTIPKEVVDERLLRPIALAPTLRTGAGVSKVFIIDEAELLDRSTAHAPVQNSILKTLEEPPAGSMVILVTSAEEALLPTIRSRCQRVAFGALDAGAMRAWFGRLGVDIPPDERAWIERFASGSPGRALEGVRSKLYAWARALEPMLDRAEAGAFHPDLGPAMTGLVTEWVEQRLKETPSASKESATAGAVRLVLSILAERQRARLRSGDPSGALEAIERVLDAERHVAAHVPVNFALENLAAQLARAG